MGKNIKAIEKQLQLVQYLVWGVCILGLGILIGYLLANTEISQCINTLAEYQTKCSPVNYNLGDFI